MKRLSILMLCLASVVTAAEKRYYWYSEKQYAALKGPSDFIDSPRERHLDTVVIVRGKRIYFTEYTRTPKPWGLWNDYRLVAVTDGKNDRIEH